MAWAVVTVASGGLPVVDSTAGGHKNIGIPVTEAVGGRGTAVTKVASGGIAVYYITAKTDGSQHPK